MGVSKLQEVGRTILSPPVYIGALGITRPTVVQNAEKLDILLLLVCMVASL